MKVSSASSLMNELVKRYQISTPSVQKATPIKIVNQAST